MCYVAVKKMYFLHVSYYALFFIHNNVFSTCQVLCAMLELDVVDNNDLKMQMVTTLQSTSTGKRMYVDLCERQIALRELVSTYFIYKNDDPWLTLT